MAPGSGTDPTVRVGLPGTDMRKARERVLDRAFRQKLYLIKL